jgi:hypothetical protein
MNLTNHKKAVILNSRQNLRPNGSDPWIKQARMAVDDAISNGYTLLTSIGMNSWEITLYLASQKKANTIVYAPLASDESIEKVQNYYINEFSLNNKTTAWLFIEIENPKKDKHKFQKERDSKIISDADIVYPVSIRPNGNMEKMIESAKAEIIDKFQIPYKIPNRKHAVEFDSDRINPNIDKQVQNHLIHWTRASNHPWPGETLYSFYKSIISSDNDYCRSGLNTLIRILSEQKLRASSRHLKKGIRAVAFSQLNPSKAINLMKWRSRYHEMSFEPYGIAIENTTAEKNGIKKVYYGNPEMRNYLEPDKRPYFQSIGRIGNWSPEKEYRHIGDIDLSSINKKLITAIVLYPRDIEIVKNVFNGRVLSLYK